MVALYWHTMELHMCISTGDFYLTQLMNRNLQKPCSNTRKNIVLSNNNYHHLQILQLQIKSKSIDFELQYTLTLSEISITQLN